MCGSCSLRRTVALRMQVPTASLGTRVDRRDTEREITSMRKQKGFSLIELLIVVAIILIIAAIAIPNLLRAKISANESSAVGSVRNVVTAETSYQTTYPQNGFAVGLNNLGPGVGNQFCRLPVPVRLIRACSTRLCRALVTAVRLMPQRADMDSLPRAVARWRRTVTTLTPASRLELSRSPSTSPEPVLSAPVKMAYSARILRLPETTVAWLPRLLWHRGPTTV